MVILIHNTTAACILWLEHNAVLTTLSYDHRLVVPMYCSIVFL